MAAISWKKGVNGNWTTASDWSTGTVPGPADDANLSATRAYTVTSDASVTVNSLTTAKGATLEIAAGNFSALAGMGTGVNAGKIDVADGASFEVGGSVDNTGTIALNSTGDATTLVIDGQVTLTGTGKVVLSNNPNNAITGASTGSICILVNNGNTISGAGQIGGNDLVLINLAGTIDANSATNALTINTFFVQPVAGQADINTGLMEATGGGMLVIDSYVNNYVGSNFGTIKASGASATVGGSTVDLHGGTIVGGAVTIGAGGTLEATGDVVSPSAIYNAVVTDNGTLLATVDTTLTLVNTTINATNGIIEAKYDLSGIVLAGATINGGALETVNGAVIETLAGYTGNPSTLNHVTIIAGSTVTVVDDTTLKLTGNITNDGRDYIGRQFSADLPIHQISESQISSDILVISLGSGSLAGDVACAVSGEDNIRAATELHKGQIVHITGTVDDHSSGSIDLKECQISQ